MKYFVDGFTIGKNPSDIGGGFTVVDENRKLVYREQINKGNFTNNEGELLGIAFAAALASPGDEIISDSNCAIIWAKAGFAKARPDLSPKCNTAKNFIGFKNLKLEWCPRHLNLAGLYNEGEL